MKIEGGNQRQREIQRTRDREREKKGGEKTEREREKRGREKEKGFKRRKKMLKLITITEMIGEEEWRRDNSRRKMKAKRNVR